MTTALKCNSQNNIAITIPCAPWFSWFLIPTNRPPLLSPDCRLYGDLCLSLFLLSFPVHLAHSPIHGAALTALVFCFWPGQEEAAVGLVGLCLSTPQKWGVVVPSLLLSPSHSPLTHWLTESNFLPCKLHSWEEPYTVFVLYFYCTFSMSRYTNTYFCVTNACSIQYSNMYRFVAEEQEEVPYSLGV